MRLANSLLFLALTMGIAALAVTGTRTEWVRAADVALEEGEAWFI